MLLDNNIKRRDLRFNFKNTLRLAKWLKLRIFNLSNRNIADLVYWRITRNGLNRH